MTLGKDFTPENWRGKSVKTGTINHPKFRRLQKQLKLPTYAVAGLLELLWMLTTQFAAEDGEIGRFSNQEIADYCDYEGDADSLVDALVASKWLERDADSLRVHDWFDHRPSFIDDRIRIRENRKKLRDSDTCSGNVREQSETVSKNRPLPSQAKPSLVQPSLGKPSQAYADLAGDAGGLAAGLDFLALAGEDQIRDVVRQAKAIEKAFGRAFGSAAEIWEVAWVGYACNEGFVPEIIDRYRALQGTDRAVKQPKRWLLGALRKELEATGVTLEEAIALVVPWESLKPQGATV